MGLFYVRKKILSTHRCLWEGALAAIAPPKRRCSTPHTPRFARTRPTTPQHSLTHASCARTEARRRLSPTPVAKRHPQARTAMHYTQHPSTLSGPALSPGSAIRILLTGCLSSRNEFTKSSGHANTPAATARLSSHCFRTRKPPEFRSYTARYRYALNAHAV